MKVLEGILLIVSEFTSFARLLLIYNDLDISEQTCKGLNQPDAGLLFHLSWGKINSIGGTSCSHPQQTRYVGLCHDLAQSMLSWFNFLIKLSLLYGLTFNPLLNILWNNHLVSQKQFVLYLTNWYLTNLSKKFADLSL